MVREPMLPVTRLTRPKDISWKNGSKSLSVVYYVDTTIGGGMGDYQKRFECLGAKRFTATTLLAPPHNRSTAAAPAPHFPWLT